MSERKRKVIPCRWIENRKGAGTSDGESGARNLEAESIRSRAENTEGCIKLTTVTEIRWSSARDTVITESVYLVLNSFLDWKPAEKLKQRCYVVSLTFFQQFCMRQRLWTEEAGRPERIETCGQTLQRAALTHLPHFAEGSFNPAAKLCRGQF